MISRPEWDRTWIITVISLMVFTPLVVLRIRQSLRQRSSVPAVASAALAAILYISWMLGLEQVWELVPAAIRGFPLPTPILEAACLHVFMVSIASDLPASKLRRRIRAELAVAVVVLVLVIGLAFGGPRCGGPDLYTCNLDGSNERQLTHVNDEWIASVKQPGVEHWHFPGEDGVHSRSVTWASLTTTSWSVTLPTLVAVMV